MAELAEDRVQLNPDAPFPPFPIWLQVPSSWSRLDSDPATWARSANDLIDTSWHGSRLPASRRREVLALLETLVADCQQAGAALSLITVGRLPTGGAASFGLHLAFAVDSRPASLGRIHDMLPRTGTTTQLSTQSGPAILHRGRTSVVVPGTAQIAVLTSLQVFLPLPDTSWTVVLSTASAYPELTDQVEAVLCAAAESIRTRIDRRQDGPDDPPGVDIEFVAANSRDRPGFERGFGTMVLRRLDPRTDHADPTDQAAGMSRSTGADR